MNILISTQALGALEGSAFSANATSLEDAQGTFQALVKTATTQRATVVGFPLLWHDVHEDLDRARSWLAKRGAGNGREGGQLQTASYLGPCSTRFR